jgi:uncharacterized membrane protein YraQ (UPF0718 family)
MRQRTQESIDSPRAIGAAIVLAVILMGWIAYMIRQQWLLEDKQQAIIDAIVVEQQHTRASQELDQ